MKTKTLIQIFVLCLAFSLNASAEFRTWTRSDGTTTKLSLVDKKEEDGEVKATFKMLNGKLVIFPISQLAEADAEYVKKWEPDAEGGGKSVFDSFLKDDLLVLKGDSFEAYQMRKKPTKYYLFYYTASWCGPCQAFTPSLVKFYETHKPDSDEFEIILVTSDDSVADMKGYAKSKNMTWPHLKLTKAASFKKKFKHPGGGIPNLVLTDLEGNLIKTSYEGKNYIGPTAVMEHLEGLLK